MRIFRFDNFLLQIYKFLRKMQFIEAITFMTANPAGADLQFLPNN